MIFVFDTGAPVLGGNLMIEIADHAAEFLDHRFDLPDMPLLLFDLEPL